MKAMVGFITRKWNNSGVGPRTLPCPAGEAQIFSITDVPAGAILSAKATGYDEARNRPVYEVEVDDAFTKWAINHVSTKYNVASTLLRLQKSVGRNKTVFLSVVIGPEAVYAEYDPEQA